MAIDRRFLNWGIFFISLGALPLLVQQGIVSHATAGDAWRLWPLVIVGLGVGILLRRTPAAFAGGLVVAATFGLVFGGFLATGPDFGNVAGCGDPNAGGATVGSQGSGTFGASGTARIEMNCGVLNVTTQAGSGWSFQGRDPENGAAAVTQGPSSFDLSAPDQSGAFWDVGGTHNRTWNVSVPADPMVDLTVGVNAGSGRLDLSGTHLSRLDTQFNAADVRLDLSNASVAELHVDVNAGSGRVVLPASGTTGSLAVNAGSLDLCAPASSGIRIHVTGALASADFGSAGLTHDGDTWTSPNFASAASRVDLQLDANLASVNLNPAGGCE